MSVSTLWPRSPELSEADVSYMRAITTQEQRDAYRQAEQARVDAAYEESLEGRLEPFHTGDPPEDIRADVRGLTPARGRYARLVAWIDAQRAEVVRLEQARSRLLDALGAPRVHQEELSQLVAKDTSGFAAWVLRGANGVKPDVHAFRRSKIEQQLADTTAEAEAARVGMAAVDNAIAFARRAADVLEGRKPRFAQAALKEAAAGRMAIYAQQLRDLETTIADLAGLHRALEGPQAGSAREIDIRLPHTIKNGMPARVTVTSAETERAAQPWRKRLAALMADPACNLEKTND